MFDFEHYTYGSGKLRIEEVDMSFECKVVVYLYTKIFNRFRKIDFEAVKENGQFLVKSFIIAFWRYYQG